MGFAREGVEGPRPGSKHHLCQTDKSEWVRETSAGWDGFYFPCPSEEHFKY